VGYSLIFTETKIAGAFIIEIEKKADQRGFFSRTWDVDICEAHGLNPRIVQANTSFTSQKGTIRGLHYQGAPYQEAKTLRCIRGRIFDVIIDLRPKSPTYLQWFGLELSAIEHKILYVPENIAHGFQTLEDNAEVTYQASQYYTPEAERGIRFNDPTINIKWPKPVSAISDKDRNWGDFVP
jgi:dTDP-4-dehydrorhamnose 3,5-epimerase